MSLTKCPDCRKLCFTGDATCASCGQAFLPGALGAQASAEERAFRRKFGALFLAAFLAALAVLFLIGIQDYMGSAGMFRS